MSQIVKERLEKLNLLTGTTHEDRFAIDRKIEEKTGKYCDKGVHDLTDEEFIVLVKKVLKRRKGNKATLAQKERVEI